MKEPFLRDVNSEACVYSSHIDFEMTAGAATALQLIYEAYREDPKHLDFRQTCTKASENASSIAAATNWNDPGGMQVGFIEELFSTVRMITRSEALSILRKRIIRHVDFPRFSQVLGAFFNAAADSRPISEVLDAFFSYPSASVSSLSQILFTADPWRQPLMNAEAHSTLYEFLGISEEEASHWMEILGTRHSELKGRQTRSMILGSCIFSKTLHATGIPDHMSLAWILLGKRDELWKAANSGPLSREDAGLTEEESAIRQIPPGAVGKESPAGAPHPAGVSTVEAPLPARRVQISGGQPWNAGMSINPSLDDGPTRSNGARTSMPLRELSVFKAHLAEKGLIYPSALVDNLHISLLAKPLAILSGISGTGKTRLALEYARYMTQDCDALGYAVVPVRPEFDRAMDLLGRLDQEAGDYRMSPALRVILNSLIDPERLYYLILDEMNIAPVERYFSDFLSAMETGEPIPIHSGGRCVRPAGNYAESGPFVCNMDCNICFFATGATPRMPTETLWDCVPPMITLPRNLCVIGTVNVDETVRPFPPKVIDRANTLDFFEVDIGGYIERTWAGRFADESGILRDIHRLLAPYGLHFGYRTVKEIYQYLTAAEVTGLYGPDTIDCQVVQKILPKFHGRIDRLQLPLTEVFRFASGAREVTDEILRTAFSGEFKSARLPGTAAKAARMLIALRTTGTAGYMG